MIQHHHNLHPRFSDQWCGDTSTPSFRRNSPITYQPKGLNHITACRKLRHPRIKVNLDAFVILTFFWLQAVSLTIRGVCSRTPRARCVDTVLHSKQSLSAIKVLANGDLLVNRIIESEKQRVWNKAVYPPPTKTSWRPRKLVSYS